MLQYSTLHTVCNIHVHTLNLYGLKFSKILSNLVKFLHVKSAGYFFLIRIFTWSKSRIKIVRLSCGEVFVRIVAT